MRRFTVLVVVLFAVAGVLSEFPRLRGIGTSVAAGVVLLAGLVTFAAHVLLGNVVAGLQIAFSRELRLDDVVVVEGEWGRIEEMTLTYVVVHLWDDRRLVLANSYFTTQPFQNWTRDLASLVGTVELDPDWSAPVQELRAELATILAHSNNWWDGRVGKLRMTGGLHGLMRLRAEVSAKDADDLWGTALPRTRTADRLAMGAVPRGAAPTAHAAPATTRPPVSRLIGAERDHLSELGEVDPQ